MQTILFSLVIFLSVTPLFSQQAEALDHLQKLQASFSREDARSYADSFTEDAVFVTPVGSVCNSRECIYQSQKGYFAMAEVDANTTFTNEVIRFTNTAQDRFEMVVRFVAENDTERVRHVVVVQFVRTLEGYLIHTMQMTPVLPFNDKQ